MPAIPIAKILLTVTDFKDVLTTKARDRGTVHTMDVLDKNHPTVKLLKPEKPERAGSSGRKKNGNGESSPDTAMPGLEIKRRRTLLRFMIASDERGEEKHTYFPIGIAFQKRACANERAAARDVSGRENFDFEKMRVTDEFLEILDTFSDRCACGCDYKFSVFIQRASDGKVGIIDPTITHGPQ